MRPIDGTRIKEWLLCPRVPYLSFHLPKSAELPPTPAMEVLFRAGRRVEAERMEEFAPERVVFPAGDFDAGFRATLEMMGRRVPAIADGVLKLGEFLGRPDLLLYSEGDERYEVADVKSARRVHASARMQVAFYSRMLAQIAPPPRFGHVVTRDGERETFELDELAASLEHVLATLQRYRAGEGDPGPHYRESCLDCRYHDVCIEEMRGRDAIELLPGVTRAQAAALKAAGVAGVAALCDADCATLAQRSGSLAVQLEPIQSRARASREGRPLRVGSVREEVRRAGFGLCAVIADRDREPAVAIAGRMAGDGRFRVRRLRLRESEAAAQELQSMLANLARSDGPVLVYGSDVRRALEEASLRLFGRELDLEPIYERFVDLRAELRRAFAVPAFDRTVAQAARAAGLDGALDGDAPALAAMRYLEGEPESSFAAVEALLERELALLFALRDFVLDGEA